MTISIDTIQLTKFNLPMAKMYSKSITEGKFLNLINPDPNSYCKNHTWLNIEIFSIQVQKWGCFLPTYINYVIEILNESIEERKRKYTYIHKDGKGRYNMIAIHDGMIVFRKTKKVYCKLLKLLCEIIKVSGC